MRKILILSHNPHRDFLSDTLVANELMRRGHCVWMRQFLQNDYMAVAAIKPDILILPEARIEYTVRLAKTAHDAGIKVIIKSCEFGITEESLPNLDDDYKKAIFGRLLIGDCVDRFLAWGIKNKKMMERFSDIPAENIVAAGGYQFDPYFAPRPQMPTAKKVKPTLLFATGFAYADRNPDYAVPEAPHDSKIHKKFVFQDSENRSRWLKMLRENLATLNEKWHVLIKPHAGEREQPYESVLKGLPYEMVIKATGAQTLMQADLLVHAGSTMAYEAHLMKIPAINFCNNNQDVVFSRISPITGNAGQLMEWISETPLGKSNANQEIIQKLENEYWGPVDGKGYLRIVDVIESMRIDMDKLVPDEFTLPNEAKYLTKDVFAGALSWHCTGCNNNFVVTNPHREMVKCPYCGIACVRIPVENPSFIKPENDNGTKPMQDLCNAGYPSGPDAEQGRCVSSVRKARSKKTC